jgi:hypothetical protein
MRTHVIAGSIGAIFAAILAAILICGTVFASGPAAAIHGTTAPHTVQVASSGSPDDIPWP